MESPDDQELLGLTAQFKSHFAKDHFEASNETWSMSLQRSAYGLFK